MKKTTLTPEKLAAYREKLAARPPEQVAAEKAKRSATIAAKREIQLKQRDIIDAAIARLETASAHFSNREVAAIHASEPKCKQSFWNRLWRASFARSASTTGNGGSP